MPNSYIVPNAVSLVCVCSVKIIKLPERLLDKWKQVVGVYKGAEG